MNIITTIAASVLMSPANVAADVPSMPTAAPTYDWKAQKMITSPHANIGNPKTMWSTTPCMCMWMGQYAVDDFTPVD